MKVKEIADISRLGKDWISLHQSKKVKVKLDEARQSKKGKKCKKQKLKWKTVKVKGIVPQFVFYQSNLIFWIVRGCSIDVHFGYKLENVGL